jgi:hypothetical protein
MAAPLPLTEDEIDDILYCARANELQELRECIDAVAKRCGALQGVIITEAVDSYTGNCALHYAAANGLLGTYSLPKIGAYSFISFKIMVLLTFIGLEIASFILSLFLQASPAARTLINKQNAQGNTSLHWASLNGHLPVVKLFLSNGADVTILNKSGYDAIFEAEMNDKGDVVEFLLKEGVGIDRGVSGGGVEGEADAEEEDIKVSVGNMEDSGLGAEEVMVGVEKMELNKDKGA